MNQSYYLVINVEIDEKDKDEFLILVDHLMSTMNALDTCYGSRLLEDQHKENAYIIFEEWASKEAFEEHTQSDYFKQYIPKIGRLYTSFKTTELTRKI